VTYRQVADDTCAGCGVLLERANTYYDREGAKVCPKCHGTREIEAAQLRATAEAEGDVARDNRAYWMARGIVALAVIAVAGVVSLWSRC
jgi:hypothetical protein